MQAGSCCPSASMNTRISPLAARAPRLMAAPLPIEYGLDSTRAPCAAATSAVSSVEPSSTTISSASGWAWRSRGSVWRRPSASFLAGRMTDRRMDSPLAARVARNGRRLQAKSPESGASPYGTWCACGKVTALGRNDMSAVQTANLVGITGIARRLVLDGALDEAVARDALDKATAARKPIAPYLREHKLVTAAQM